MRVVSKSRRLAGIIIAASLFAGGAQAAAINDVEVRVDEAKLLRLERPAAEIIVGNPSIAAVAVQNTKLLVITGKSFGRTNIIVIDADGKEVINRSLSVEESERGLVTLHRGGARYTYYCAPNCTSPLSVGDDTDYFDAIAKEVKTKQSMGQSSAEGAMSPD